MEFNELNQPHMLMPEFREACSPQPEPSLLRDGPQKKMLKNVDSTHRVYFAFEEAEAGVERVRGQKCPCGMK